MKLEAIEEQKAPHEGVRGRPSYRQWKAVKETISSFLGVGTSSPMPRER
jgi:hypothetical protein